MGRFRHEGAESIMAEDGRAVLYSGDDNRLDYVYKFATEGKVSDRKTANVNLFADSIYVARCNDDGTPKRV